MIHWTMTNMYLQMDLADAFVAIVLENHKLLLVIVALEKVSESLQN
jgi:hypothetical protein